MNYKYLILSLFLIVGIFLAGCTEQQVNKINADEIAKKMQEKYESIKSMEADVLITMNMMGQTKTMQYKYAFEKPNKFYMEGDDALIVCDGKTCYNYDKKTNQYAMMEIKGEENDIFNPDYGKFIKSMLKNFNVSYLGEENYDGRKCYVLELISKENPEEKMKMYVDEEYWQPLKIEMDGITIEYKNVKFNVDIPDERFKFTPPEGAKLMSSGKMAMSKDDIRALIKEGVIKKKQKKGISSARVKKLKEQRKKGRRRGPGSRRGAAGARTPQKERWMATIRALRKTLRHLRDTGKIDRKLYRKLYRMAKGGAFRSRSHLFLYLREHGLLKQ